jgi:glycosyltransferase involved in cell wall biosynthesis
MKKIILISVFGHPENNDNSRISNVYDYLTGEKLIITSDFDHKLKTYKNKDFPSNRNIMHLHVPAYKKNISLYRIYSHYIFSKKKKKYLQGLYEKPDIIYCAMPTSTAAYIAGKYCKKNNCKFVIDVIDLWPDSLIPVSKLAKLMFPFLFVWGKITKKAYQMADLIYAESKQYAEIAHAVNPDVPYYYAYLGVDLIQFNNKVDVQISKNEGELLICYGGSLSNSYDFDTLLDALVFLKEKDFPYKFIFVGDGLQGAYLKEKIGQMQLNAIITGALPYDAFIDYLSQCDIGINIFKKDTKVIHSYKFNDYLLANLFILNSLEGETAEMVEQYHVGKNFNFTTNLLKDVLYDVCENWEHYKTFKNHKALIEDVLNKQKIYRTMCDNIILDKS